jgi:hypothetical protein
MFRQLFQRSENNDGPEPVTPEPTVDSDLSTLRIPMCRYDVSGNLERDNVLVFTTQYLAISHVLGDAQWHEITGIDGEVLYRKRKQSS